MKRGRGVTSLIAVLVISGLGASVGRSVDILRNKPGEHVFRGNDEASVDLLKKMGSTDARGDVASFEQGYADHPRSMLLHVLAGSAFFLLAGLQFSKKIRNRYRAFHRWSGRFLLFCVVLINVSALYYGITIPYGGRGETTVTVLVAFWMLYATWRAYSAIRERDIDTHRAFMTRVFATALGISVARVVSIALVLVFHGFHAAFVPSLWIGFGLSIGAGEVWLRASRNKVAVTNRISKMKTVAGVVSLLLFATSSLQAQKVRPEPLRKHLFTIAHDTMGGRDTGGRGNYLTADYVAAQFKQIGLQPAGDNGTFFQTIPFVNVRADGTAQLGVGSKKFVTGNDVLPLGPIIDWSANGATAVAGGVLSDSSTWIAADAAAGKVVVFSVTPEMTARQIQGSVRFPANSGRFANAVGIAVAGLERFPLDIRAQRMQGFFTTTPPTALATRAVMLVTTAASNEMIGKPLSGGVRIKSFALEHAARNVIAMLPGSDPALKSTYVTLTAHNDHVGYSFASADHDSVYAYNRVIRGLGADTPDRMPTADEWTRINAVRDSLRKIRPSRRDSIFNGADDDGTGTVALLEVARALAVGPKPKRSIVFVSHAAEERGLLGSRWFTEHATVPRDSIIGEMDMDMIGRGNTKDLPEGNPDYLEVVGASRLSHEYGQLLDAVNAKQARPFKFNLTYDQPGHPLQYYCRADHYSYARYGIPAFAVSRGEHADYHQVTDEAQYIDYDVLARVANLALDFVRTVANLDHRPVLDQPKQDPNTPCRQ
ncbi:MAG TPA: M20/M25/M40 family metallo-hydrolase [Longimicrobiales bacterium]|nr:M20/M25/M40 family metallo-hydrolase [Longimicrobiales bacterium]